MRHIILAIFTVLALVACGGGGESSNSSFSGTKTFGSTSFSCSSESAQNSCTSSTNCSSCTCTTGCTSGTPITATCAVAGTTLTATTAGCTGEASGVKTFVCDGTKLVMLSGTGHTAAAVIAGGSTFGGSGITVGGITINCS